MEQRCRKRWTTLSSLCSLHSASHNLTKVIYSCLFVISNGFVLFNVYRFTFQGVMMYESVIWALCGSSATCNNTSCEHVYHSSPSNLIKGAFLPFIQSLAHHLENKQPFPDSQPVNFLVTTERKGCSKIQVSPWQKEKGPHIDSKFKNLDPKGKVFALLLFERNVCEWNGIHYIKYSL